MKKIVRQVAGIDVAQKELVVSLGRMYEDLSTEIHAFKTFPNHEKGFSALLIWSEKIADPAIPIRFVMEATGVYHESLAYYLAEKRLAVTIVLPSKISNFFRTLDIKTITDKTASQAIATFGLERNLTTWQPPKKVFRVIRQLTRERDQLIAERTVLKNQSHAEQAEAFPNKGSLTRLKERIRVLNKQEKQIMAEIAVIIKQDEELKKIIAIICTIPGVGLLTAACVLGETNGFELIRNKKQITSYAGLDVKEKESGTSVKGKPRISKRGNRHLRKAMHMPSLTIIRKDERFKAMYARLISKHGIKMKACVAVQRKLLEMIYTLHKTKQTYNKDYFKQGGNDQNKVAA